jgi:poly(glycerol-phosphate) alpha-glucosyltransferase
LTAVAQSAAALDIAVAMDGCSRLSGGVFTSVVPLYRTIAARGARVTVAAVADAAAQEDLPRWGGVDVRLFRHVGLRAYGFSPGLRRFLRRSEAHVVHHHGLWMDSGAAALAASEARRIPLVLNPHGMLEPWALARSRWKKRVVGLLWQFRALRDAACIRVLCDAEAASARAFGLRQPLAVIPNGVDLAELEPLPPRDAIGARFPGLHGRRRALVLSRLHPIKNLPALLRAWAGAGRALADWVLVVAGPDEVGHGAELRSLAADLGLERAVHFTGALYGAAKLEALAGADLFVLPSFSEGLPVAALEAAACRIPMLLTPGCHLPDMAAAGAALAAEPTADALARGLIEAAGWSDAERRRRGEAARRLVEGAYTWDRCADAYLAVSRWLAEGGAPPGCVRSS